MHCADMVNISQKYQRGPYESHQSYRFLAVVNGLDERGGSCGSRALIATLKPSHNLVAWLEYDLAQLMISLNHTHTSDTTIPPTAATRTTVSNSCA